MRNVFLTFVLLVFLAPAGSAFGQPAATVTFSNPNEALAYNELVRVCNIVKKNINGTVLFYSDKSGEERRKLVIEKVKILWQKKQS